MFFFRGLDKLFFVILIFNCSTNFAQSKNLDIETSEDIEKLISLKILLNKKNYENNYQEKLPNHFLHYLINSHPHEIILVLEILL